MDYDLLDHSGEMGDPFSDKFEPDTLDIHDIIGTAPRVMKSEPIDTPSHVPPSQQSTSSRNRHPSSGSDNMEFDTDSDAQSRTKQSDEESRTAPRFNSICKTEIDLNEYMELEKNLQASANNCYQSPPRDACVDRRRTFRRYGPGLDCIMSDHNYSNQLDDSQDCYAPVDANDLTLSELLERVQDKLCEGSPVYDVRLELLSLVASLANEKVEMSKNFMNSVEDKLKLIKLSMEASSQSSEVSMPDTVEMVPLKPAMFEADVQTDEFIPETKEPIVWEESPKMQENVRNCLKKLHEFSENLPNTNAQLVNDLSKDINEENHLSIFTNFIGTMESGFREIVKEFKSAANLSDDRSKTERSPSTSARKLNQKSKDRWLADLSSDDDDDHTEADTRKQKPDLQVTLNDETIESRGDKSNDAEATKARDQELLDAVESIENRQSSPEGALDDRQRTLSCDYMEKLVYETDSNDETPNDLYESFDNYQPIEPLKEPLREESFNELTAANSSASTGYAEVSGMSDEEFLGFAEDIVFEPAAQTAETNENENVTKSTLNEPETNLNTTIKEEESLDINASQLPCSEDEHEGLDNLLSSTGDKDFEFDGEFFLDSVCDEPTTERLLEAAQTFEDDNVVDQIEEDHDHSTDIVSEHQPAVETQSEKKQTDHEFETDMDTATIDYLQEEAGLDIELDRGDDVKTSVITVQKDEVESPTDFVQHEETVNNDLELCAEVTLNVSTQDDDKLDQLDNEQLEKEQAEKEQHANEQPDNELVDDNQVETDQVESEPVHSEQAEMKVKLNGKIEEIAPEVQQLVEDGAAFHIEDSSSHESGFMMPVEVQMDVEDDSLHMPGAENGITDDERNEEGNTEREIDRLLDFSNLNVRKRAHDGTYYVPLKKPEPSKQPKPVAASLIDDVAQAVNDCETPNDANNEHPSDSLSDIEDDVMTEEQFLHQCNMNTKEKLMMMLSSDSEGEQMSGSENTISGVESEAIDDEEAGDNSRDSAIEMFLKIKVKEEMNSVLDASETKTNGVAKVENGLPESKSDQKTKTSNDSSVDKPPNENTSESADSSADDDIVAPTKFLTKQEKHIMGKSIFSGLDEFLADEPPEPVIDLNEIDAISERSSLSSDCELLDTSMFKTSNTSKEIDDKKLSRLMKNSRRAAVAKAAQPVDDCISLSSDTDLELDEDVVEVPDDAAEPDATKDGSQGDKNRAPRRMLRADQLADATKSAQTEEKERVKRLEKKGERLTQLLSESTKNADDDDAPAKPTLEESDIVLDYDSKAKCRITVHPDIVKHLKPHQVDGVKFMYDSCYGSVDDKHVGSGCILAHCMGLGKTLQLIALLHTLIRHAQLKTNKILVICPKSTVMNWAEEIERWLGPVRGGPSVKVFQFPDSSDINEKLKVLKSWQNSGRSGYAKAGFLLIGYEAFRTLVFYHLTKKRKLTMAKDQLDAIKRKVEETLLKPGADIVICDEGHMIKNRKSATSLAVNEIKTRKRIILTGTPIQNNLKEYYSMVNFIKPSFLGTEKEFANLYANPIRVGQHKDSSKGEIKFMKQRSYVLHKKLSKFVQRREAALLKTFLPEKYEYVLFIPMTDVQNRLYVHFLENNPLKDKYGGKSLIPDYTFLRKIWTHPKVLESAYKNALILMRKKESKGLREKRNVDSEDEQPDDVLDSQQGSMSVTSDWWKRFVTADDLESLLPSNKLRTLFEILQMCQENGEKCLVFSAFVAVLDVVEYFMKLINNQTEAARVPGLERYSGPWVMTKDYYRLDGKTPKSIRHAMITRFNDPANSRTRCFLISAKAGGQGINLIGANRVVLLDTSWNPSNDQQNIFRVFRLGQKNKCYIYRLLAMGTMEEKVYSRSVTKQAMSFRVVDEQQIDRHYSMAELAELYTLTIPDYNARPTPIRPYDNVLASLLHNFSDLVYKYHEHDSLLERNSEQDLSEEEKADAWAAYEKDVSLKNQYGNMPHLPGADNLFNQQNPFGGLNMSYPQMGSFGQFGYPNSAAMMNNFLSSMGPYGTSTAMEKEIAMLSQMYNSPYASLLASTARGGSSSSQYPYGSPYTSGILPPLSSTSGVPPYTPTTSGSSFGPNPYNLPPQHQSLMTNMNSYLPQFNKSPNALPPLPPSLSGPSTSTPVPSYRPLHQTSALRDIDKDVWSYLTNASNMYNKDDLLGNNVVGPVNYSSGSNIAPGPNAMKNPLLFKELSIPCAEPVPSGSAGHNLPSIPTSVITSVGSSKDSPIAPSAPQPQPQTKPLPNPNSSMSPMTTTTTGIASGSAVTVTTSVNKDLVRTVAASNLNRRSPLTTKTTASLLSPTQRSSSPAVVNLSSTTPGPQISPEPHIIVKNVNAINQSIKSIPAVSNKLTTPTQSSPKPPVQSVKNINMGIVYPANKKPPTNQSELENNNILRAAQAQLNALATTKSLNISNTTNSKTTQPTSMATNLGAVQSDRVNVTTAPISSANPATKNTRVYTRSVPVNSSPLAGSSKVTRRLQPPQTDPLATKPNDARTTIDPKRWSNQSGLTISPVPTTAAITYKATPMKTTQLTGTPVKPNIYTTAAQNLLKNNTKPSPISVTTIRQPLKTPGMQPTNATTFVRQNTAPTFTTGQPRFNNVIQSTNNGTTIIRQQVPQKGRTVPPLVRQNTTPTISTNQPGANIKPLTTSTPTPGTSNTPTVLNRNVTVRRLPPGKATVTNTQFTATPSSAGTPTSVGKPLRTNTTMPMVQRTVAPGNPPAKLSTTIRSGVVTTPNRSVAGLPVRQTQQQISTPVRTIKNGNDGIVRRIVLGSGGTAVAAGRPPGTLATNVVQQQQQQQNRAGVVRTTTGPIMSTSAGTMSGTSGVATTSGHKVIPTPQLQQQQQIQQQQQQRKRKAATDLLPSISITEIKKARMVAPGAPNVVRQQSNLGKNEITIVPRTVPAPVVRRGPKPKPKPTTMETVQLD